MTRAGDPPIVWRGVVLSAQDEIGVDYWRESNRESEWAVTRTADGTFVAVFNVSHASNGDWDYICEATGATAADALDASLAALLTQVPLEVRARADAIDAAVRDFTERVREIDSEHPVAAMRRALDRVR